MSEQTIPEDIIKIQKKLATFEKGSRNYNKYTKILKKHIKNHNMRNRVKSHINTIDTIHGIIDKPTNSIKIEKETINKIIKKDIDDL